MGRNDNDLKKWLNNFNNFYAGLFNCNENNYKEVLDKYFFIGIMEEYSSSVEILSKLVGIEYNNDIPKKNISSRDNKAKQLAVDIIKDFKKRNNIDYLIYNYCLLKFNSLKEKHLIAK